MEQETFTVTFSLVYNSMGGGNSWELDNNSRPFATKKELIEFYGIINVKKCGEERIPLSRSFGWKRIVLYTGEATRNIKSIKTA